MNLINLIKNFFGFNKRSSGKNFRGHQRVYLGIDYDKAIKKRFPERKKSPKIYVPNPSYDADQQRVEYKKWREENFGKYSSLEEIDETNKRRINDRYLDVEDLIILDKSARNSALIHSYDQIKRIEKGISENIFSAELNTELSRLKGRYENKINSLKNYSNQHLLNEVIYETIDSRTKNITENREKYLKIIKDYFESKLKY